MTIFKEYIHYHDKYIKKYGEKTVILMEIGSFYEMYGTDDKGPKLSDLASILNIVMTRKDKSNDTVDSSNHYIVGFPKVSLAKYLKVLMDNNYTVVKIDQITAPPRPKRAVTNVYSPSTYIEDTQSPDSNCIVSLYIEDEIQNNGTSLMCIGMSVIDLSTGENCVHEAVGVSLDEKYPLDEAARFITSYNPKEVLIYKKEPRGVDLKEKKIMSKDQIIVYLDLQDTKYCYFDKAALNKNFSKISYQNDLFRKVFKDVGMLQPIEYLDMERIGYARISYVYLLDYAYQHNENLVNFIYKPSIFDNNSHLILGNNAVHQLNVFEDGTANYTLNRFKSLFDVVNNTSTSIGRRYLKRVLAAPLVSAKELNSRYDRIEEAIENNNYLKLENSLKGVADIERLHRKLSLSMLHPIEFSNLMKSYSKISVLLKFVNKCKQLKTAIVDKTLSKKLKTFTAEVDKVLDVEEMKKHTLLDIDGSFFRDGVYKDIDEIQNKIVTGMQFMNSICSVLSDNITDKSKFSKKGDQKIYLKHNDRDGYYLFLSNLRAESLKKNLKKKRLNMLKITDSYTLDISKLEFKKLPSSGTKIFCKDLTTRSDEVVILRDKITGMVKEKYKEFMAKLYNDYGKMFKSLSDFIGVVDFVKSSAKTAVMYNYTKPTVVENKKSYVSCEQLRHPIIERINTEVNYVPHDIKLGSGLRKNKLDGMLIYGINSSGKSSLMKAIGLSIIMAQCGMFVPAKKYVLSPYRSMFARITSSDNIFKGLSSFALEMTELRAILRRTGPNTLIIGDEVCRGTEHVSGNSIVAATLIQLANTGSSFIFATHLHDIARMKKIKRLKNIGSFHLSVEFDKKRDMLIFDRVLKEGAGPDLYGITVAQYIIQDNEFMKLVHKIKNTIVEESSMLLSDKTSRYNSGVFIDKCGVCKIKKEIKGYFHTHHIIHQKDCKDGFSKDKPHVPKNNKSNLVPMCESCHQEVHHGNLEVRGYKDTSKGPQLDFS